MRKRTLLLGVIIVSCVLAVFLAVAQIGQSGSQYTQGDYSVREVEVSEEGTVASYALSRNLLSIPSLSKESQSLPLPSAGGEYLSSSEPKLIKTAVLSLEVDSCTEALKAVEETAANHNGYVADSAVQQYDDREVGHITVRVPEDSFEEAVKDIENVGDLKKENLTLEDVTEQYIDLKARLDNLEHQEQRYLEILEMATTVEDVLKVETQLERIRGEIESLQGTLNYMETQIRYSVIYVQLAEPEEVVHDSGIGRAFDQAIDGFLGAIRGIIIFLGYFIPVALFLTALAVGGMILYRKIFKKQ
ncbi:MAG: DUF4349 domain-containing protein [Theionarchaea archaeon]|nr:DUF4349 domain-containing protein [Theionarchaea archaeon]MBU7019469.1 DUF4349 domain-containing protein [Theionarchaea archaeon]MBU7035411.1 DUF4349 domain-containing protein [Theionarchaea archaeon]MBU7041234.1 DUF4349 domain-containing protein [Theionarchaea archaeon]